MDLIDRQKAIEALQRDPLGGLNYDGILKRLPTVEAKPVRHGHWVRKGLLFHCSACSYGAFNSYFVYGARYCPICGARMDERSEE